MDSSWLDLNPKMISSLFSKGGRSLLGTIFSLYVLGSQILSHPKPPFPL